jgi:hypothetical protein
LFILAEIQAEIRWPWGSMLHYRALSGQGQSHDDGLVVRDSPITETVADANPTEPRGEDGGKIFLGVLKSYMEYQTAKTNKANDNRPSAIFYDGLGKNIFVKNFM